MLSLSINKKDIKRVVGVFIFLGLILLLSGLFTPKLYAAPSINAPNQPFGAPTPTPTPQNVNTGNSDDITCAIEKMGWVLCPIIETAGKVGDQAFSFLSNNFLETEPELVASVSSGMNKPGTYVAWEYARNIANVLFIAAMLIIVLSQVTGRGVTNYGIKKLLPKLIVAAILVNISYYICQLLVDLTNFLGYSIKDIMVGIAHSVTDSVVMPPQTSIDNQTSSGALGLIAGGALSLAGLVWFLLPVLFLTISTVVITCLVIIAILLMRKAFIVLLVVLAPIAFVAYLLPNTEKYFQKWLSMFWKLLLVFPIVSLLFGAGQLASAIILVAGTTQTTSYSTNPSNGLNTNTKCIQLATTQVNNGNVTIAQQPAVKQCGTKSTPFLLGLVAAGIAVAPLIAVWAVLKGALSAAGAIGGKIAGQIQNTGNSIGKYGKAGEDKLKKRMGANVGARWQNMQSRGIDENGIPTNTFGRIGMRRVRRDERLRLAKEDLDRSQRRSLDTQLAGAAAGELTSGLADPTHASRAAQARRIADANKQEAEEMNAGRVAVSQLGADAVNTQALAGINGGDVDNPRVAAAIERAMKIGSSDQKAAIIDALRGRGYSLASRTAAASLESDNSNFFGASAIDNIRRGANTLDYRQLALNGIIDNRFTADKMANANGDTARYAASVAVGHTGATDNLRREAQIALNSEATRSRISTQREALEAMQ